jgi:excisionase family DNA binding protein
VDDRALAGFMRVQEAATLLRVTDRRVRQLIGGGALKAVAISGRLYLVRRESVERYAIARRAAGRPRKRSS